MKKMIKRISLVVCLIVTIVFCFQTVDMKVEAATIGQQLVSPEAGWQRIDDSDSRLYYREWWTASKYGDRAYKGTWSGPNNSTSNSLTIKFKGTKFRIIGIMNSDSSNYPGCRNVKVTIDNSIEDSYSCNGSLVYKVLLYEKSGLEDTEHTVVINVLEKGYACVDAIDIDEDGELLDANPTKVSDITLNKSDITMNAEDTEDLTATILPEDAANKEITWTSSNEKVCTVDENGKVTAISTGTAVVAATAKDGSGKTASCNVTVVDNRRGVLTINMTSGKEYSYDMSMDEINNFVNWYEGRIDGEGSNYYVLKVTPSSGAYNTRTHHLNFNNISDFIIETYK